MARATLFATFFCLIVGAAGQDGGAGDACQAQLGQAQGELAQMQQQLMAAAQQLGQKVDRSELEKVQAELAAAKAQLAQMVDSKHLDQAKADLETCKTRAAAEPPAQVVSIVGAAKAAWGVASNGVTQLLDQTEVDEQLYEQATKHYGTAKDLASDLVEKARAVDYASLAQEVQKHELYTTHVSPNLEKVTTALKPHWDQHAAPLLEKVQEQATPVLKQAQEHYDVASKKVQEEVVPVLTKQSTQALDTISEAPVHLEKASSSLDKLIDPVFAFLAKLSPSHAGSLPTGVVDRILFLLLCTFFGYQLFFVFRRSFVVTLKLTRLSVKVNWTLFRWLLLKPLRLFFKVFWLCVWFGTFFHCCGLCTRRKATNGKTNGNGQAPAATLEELEGLMEQAKKEKKLEAAAKELVKLMKSAKPLSTPKKMKGKVVTKEVLTKAVAKFKDLNASKLGL